LQVIPEMMSRLGRGIASSGKLGSSKQEGSRTMQYVIVYDQTPNNWAAYVPDLPGCIATGKTRDEVDRLIREAIVIYLEAAREFGQPVPSPGTWTAVADVPA
jgi:predicted RNase H-like HicB family nuclease